MPDGKSKPTIVMTLHPAPPPSKSDRMEFNHVIDFGSRLPIRWLRSRPRARFCTSWRAPKRGEKGADEALLVNTNGEVAESAGGNLFWTHDDTICTAPTACGALPGVTRATVLEICKALVLETSQRAIKPEALRNSAGLFVTQSALGIVPVAAFDGTPVTPSPLVDQIARAYREMLVQS
jgi:branched-subunit amino acid aminotransferase/4-amino-4-deoxychorismate lyase